MGVAALVVLAVLVATAQGQDESIFERSFEDLHKPPLSPASVRSRAKVETHWIEQKVDHFNTDDDRIWNMRYMVNDKFYTLGGPFFISVGGEWNITAQALTHGHFHDMAKEHHGILFQTEHRYYGESRPTSDLSTNNLQYLNVRQALADLAHFIRVKKATIKGASESKVILKGGSYAASMVTWFKKLYPDVATGCWASSAPLHAKLDCFEYLEVAGESIRKLGGQDCYDRIENATAVLEQLFESKEGAQQVKTLLNLCKTFDENYKLDLWTLFHQIALATASVVQHHHRNTIQNMCKNILKGEDDLHGLVDYLIAKFNSTKCHDLSYNTFLKGPSKTKWSTKRKRQWTYQTCNEFGWFHTSSSRTQPFGSKFPLELHLSMCADIFGVQFTHETMHERTKQFNKNYGDLYPKVENVYMTHGALDPWRSMGIQNKHRATVIPLHAHCSDFGSINSNDTPEMRASKEKIAELVSTWLEN